ncbi:uncharacterized protein MKK02DRAFT_40954 [Dioszegia hungarica]|uniref:Uncharacterized protein n=1 Tax=Dioszegia hungarica TaxID=4972 RepID=A0AA38H198_9TREE|nr:uncharacterized protein MKK02DRAFT_40954 [Dioszegia hungarica]KAI9632648.1 hypothetical protein MKK02DRAFT_40954 [Dioszegia hungarica]
MGPERGWEEDVIFPREEVLADEAGVWIEEGATEYEFAFILPDDFLAMDWHANAKIKHELYAIVEGQPQQSQGIWTFQSTRSVSPISGPSRRSSNPRGGKGGSPDSTPSRSPSPDVQGMSRLALDTPSISLVRRQELPQAPSYEAAVGAQDGASWLEGTFSVNRSIRVFWNPNTSGGVDSLDDGLQGRTDPPGNYTIQLNAPLWTVCCILHARVRFPSLPPTATIFSVRLDLLQTVTLRSPRDEGSSSQDKQVRTTKRILIHWEGKQSSRSRDIKSSGPALWRGAEADGEDSGEFVSILKGRLPHDVDTRPSTMEVETPVHVSHQLVFEIVYSMWGRDHLDQPLSKTGPGELRIMTISRPFIIPSCVLIPDIVGLPKYAATPDSRLALQSEQCPLCKIPPEDRLCLTCPYDRPSHARHDHPPKLVGNPEGSCPVCSVLLPYQGDSHWRNCACAMGLEELERLGKKLQAFGGATAVGMWGDLREGREGFKDEYERGTGT